MKRTRATTYVTYLLFAPVAAGVVGCKTETPSEPVQTDDDDTSDPCAWDRENDIADGAVELSADTPEEHFICPIGDQDWFRFSVPEDASLVRVQLEQTGPAPSINPIYTIFEEDGTTVAAQPDTTESAGENRLLEVVHVAAPGDYYIRVLDQAQDALDKNHPYVLTVSTLSDRDTHEPNNDAQGAAAAGTDDISGYISFRGDEDWYQIESPKGGLLHVTMSIESSSAPSYRLVDEDGNDVVIRANTEGLVAYDYHDALDSAGTYYIVVYNEDPLQFDPESPYTLAIDIGSDPDANEPNDVPADAVALSSEPASCGSEWSDWAEQTGYIASSGDIDWYKLDVTGSDTGLIDVTVTFDADARPDTLHPAVRLVYAAEKSCTVDQDCQALETTCTEDIECSRLGNTCRTSGLSSGFCAGAGTCMPDGVCGATLIYRTSAPAETSNPDAPPSTLGPPNVVRIAAPLFGVSTMYIAVEDYKGDAQSATAAYTVRARVAQETDAHEPSEAYMNRPAAQNESVVAHEALASEVPVHTCTGTAADDCCDDTTWVEGAISYTYDQDWYHYAHPCPEQDCMVRIRYDVDGGPVDAFMLLYRDNELWHDRIVPPISDTGNQDPLTGYCGGLETTDTCLYAYRSDEGYYFTVRDTTIVSDGSAEVGTWDWDRGQRYRFCVERIADECAAPCFIWESGCGHPSKE